MSYCILPFADARWHPGVSDMVIPAVSINVEVKYFHEIGIQKVYLLYQINMKCQLYCIDGQSYYLINTKNPNYWICLLLIQQIISNMVSSAIYYNQLLSVLLVFVFVNFRKKHIH